MKGYAMAKETPREPSEAYVFRAQDGSLYLIRDEVLAACKMEGEDLEFARQEDARNRDDAEKFEVTEGPFSQFARVDYTQSPGFRFLRSAEPGPDTIMCGW
jgi:hypothetical protein